MFPLKTLLLLRNQAASSFHLSNIPSIRNVRWLTQSKTNFFKVFKKNNETPEENFEIHPGYLKFKETQKLYQVDDGKPIWLKRPMDKLLFGLTWLLMFIAVGLQFKMVFDLGFVAKK